MARASGSYSDRIINNQMIRFIAINNNEFFTAKFDLRVLRGRDPQTVLSLVISPGILTRCRGRRSSAL
jgi:hypothetical protein